MTTVGELVIAGPAEPWKAIGLGISDGCARVGGIVLRFGGDGSGIVEWTLIDLPEMVTDVDGLPTRGIDDVPDGPRATETLAWDHLVVTTSSLERTCGAIEAATAAPLKRIREAGAVRQGFHRLGELIIEVVESAQVTSDVAQFWGFVWVVDDLHDWCDRLGPDVIGLPKPAVQPGRFIATVRPALGLGVPLALMTPDQPHR